MPYDPHQQADADHPAASEVLLHTRTLIAVVGCLLLLALAGLAVMELQIQATSKAARIAKTASSNADHTLTSVIAEARAAQADPANVAAQLRSRERIIANCVTAARIARAVGVQPEPCPAEPATTTTTEPGLPGG